jgi:hypothetical protein
MVTNLFSDFALIVILLFVDEYLTALFKRFTITQTVFSISHFTFGKFSVIEISSLISISLKCSERTTRRNCFIISSKSKS